MSSGTWSPEEGQKPEECHSSGLRPRVRPSEPGDATTARRRGQRRPRVRAADPQENE